MITFLYAFKPFAMYNALSFNLIQQWQFQEEDRGKSRNGYEQPWPWRHRKMQQSHSCQPHTTLLLLVVNVDLSEDPVQSVDTEYEYVMPSASMIQYKLHRLHHRQ